MNYFESNILELRTCFKLENEVNLDMNYFWYLDMFMYHS